MKKKKFTIAVFIVLAFFLLACVNSILENIIFYEYWEYTKNGFLILDFQGYEQIYHFYCKYDPEWMIGKTDEEIKAKCGEFDRNGIPDENGCYTCSYEVLNRASLGGSYFVVIKFENHVAVNAYGKFII